MEDVLTENPPPSRFFQEDLNNFASLSPEQPLPSPFILFSNPKPQLPLKPSLLIIALSSPSLYISHGLPSKSLIGTLILPELPFSGNTVEPSLQDRSCNIYSLSDNGSVLLVSVQLPVSPERSNLVSRLLVGGQDIVPERVVILDSVQSRNFRGRLSPDEALAAKLETSAEKKAAAASRLNLDYFPSGSVVDGLGAALLSRCQLKNIRGTLVVTWPEFDPSVVRFVGALLKSIVPSLDIKSVDKDVEKYSSRAGLKKDAWVDSDLYT
ncbi:hypothetical protein HA466_0244580 [Hirschfeldia incana]|nr:hypothetical protein HA466_0244580 [Hirschfeldia incana]